MNALRSLLFLMICALSGFVCATHVRGGELEEQNKASARRFYEQVWFSRNMSAVDELFAPTYIAHDIGDRKNSMENAEEQKKIAEFFWQRGTMTGSIDYQVAEGDLVATRWQWHFKPEVWWMRLLGGREQVPIINVFRFRDGKIVEIWNHRHDIDTVQANFIFVKGVIVGLVPAMLMAIALLVSWLRRRRRSARPHVAAT